jgi:hypothetical protein
MKLFARLAGLAVWLLAGCAPAPVAEPLAIERIRIDTSVYGAYAADAIHAYEIDLVAREFRQADREEQSGGWVLCDFRVVSSFSASAAAEFVAAVQAAGVRDWEYMYADYTIVDGGGWDLEITWAQGEVQFVHAINPWDILPAGYDQFQEALETLTGVRIL